MDRLDQDPGDTQCEEVTDDDTVDADEEYPREEEELDDGHPGPFASVAQIAAYYEKLWGMPGAMSGFPDIEREC